MCSRRLSDANPKLQEAYKKAKIAFEAVYPQFEVILTCTYRSHEEQERLYNQPWDGIDNNNNGLIDEPSEKVTNAKPGQSKHNHYPSLAIDIAFKYRGEKKLNWNLAYYKKFYDIIKGFEPAIRWGGFFKFVDGVHYEI